MKAEPEETPKRISSLRSPHSAASGRRTVTVCFDQSAVSGQALTFYPCVPSLPGEV